MKNYIVVCGEFDSEQEAQIYAKLLGAWNIPCKVQEQKTDQSQNLADALLLIAEQLQQSNDMQAKMCEKVLGKKDQKQIDIPANPLAQPVEAPKEQETEKPQFQLNQDGNWERKKKCPVVDNPSHSEPSSHQASIKDRAESALGTKIKPTLGSVIKSYRLAKNMSQREVAKKAGVSQTVVSRYEANCPIQKPVLLKLMAPLDIPMGAIQPYLNDFKGDVYHA